jgi:pyruvate dehydrogenase E2 component (dihydrolipoamide acetyltransferase)
MRRHEVTLPDLGLGDRPVVVGLWLARRGGRVSQGDPLVELLAGEALIDLPAPVAGTLVETLVGEDQPVRRGQGLAVIEVDDAT